MHIRIVYNPFSFVLMTGKTVTPPDPTLGMWVGVGGGGTGGDGGVGGEARKRGRWRRQEGKARVQDPA